MAFQVNDPGIDELGLIQAARKDVRKFSELYNLYVDRVYRYLFSRLGNVQDAEDITSQTFLTAFEAFDRYRQDGHFASWLFTIARNKAMDHFRGKKKFLVTHESPEIPVRYDPISDVIRVEQFIALKNIILTLPEVEQELLRLRFVAEMSFPEIAHLLHRKEDAVKKSTYRILANLQSRLEDSNG